MRLVAPSGDFLGLRIVGYEFPDLETAEYDSNWLRVHVSAALDGRSWATTDPCLLTYEAAELADWLEKLAGGAPDIGNLAFIEPNLTFRVVDAGGEGLTLRVYLELEARPPWALADGAPAEDLWLDFPVDRTMLLNAGSALRDQLRSYPQRAHV